MKIYHKLCENWQQYLHEGQDRLPDVIEDLLQQSRTFRHLWDMMQQSIEDSKHHHGESTAEHTLNVIEHMQSLSTMLPLAERELMLLLAALHDVGKPAERKDNDGTVTFHGHASKSAELAAQVLDEIFYEEKELLLQLIKHHMLIFDALRNNHVARGLAKKNYAYMEKLAIMAKADAAAVNRDESEQIDALVNKVEQLRKQFDKQQREQELRQKMAAAMSPEEFVADMRARNVPDSVLPGALRGKYKHLNAQEIERLLSEAIWRIT